jgi:hypothetical protein
MRVAIGAAHGALRGSRHLTPQRAVTLAALGAAAVLVAWAAIASLGTAAPPGDPSLEELTADPARFHGESVVVEGRVVRVGPRWLTLSTPATQRRLNVLPAQIMRLPTVRRGDRVEVLGRVRGPEHDGTFGAAASIVVKRALVTAEARRGKRRRGR